MNSFLDVAANHRSSLNVHKNYSDLKQLSPKLTHTPLAQQSNNTNHGKSQSTQNGSNQTKNPNRRKHSTYQSNNKKRNFSATHNLSLAVDSSGSGSSVDNRPISRLGNNSSSNHNANVSSKRGDKFQTKDCFDSVRSTNISTRVSSNSSSSAISTDGSNIKPSKDQISKVNNKGKTSPAMDIRSARLMIPHPAAQHSQPHMSLLSPNVKSIYSLDYMHRSQIADRYNRTQQSDFFNSNSGSGGNSTANTNGNRLSYTNERNNGSRYNSSNGNSGSKYSNKGSSQANNSNSNASVSPPLSVTSSGSSTNSGKNNRASKSYNGNVMHSINNNHRNIPTTPTLQQSHNGYFQSQNMPFFHSNSTNGMQQIFATAMSPNNQSQHSNQPNQSVGLYVQQNSSSAYHPNNNYHSHNRNYHSNGSGNGNNGSGKKSWMYSKNKPEANGNYSSSNSSTTSSTHSSDKSNASKYSSSRNNTPPSSSDSSMHKHNSSDKLPMKKLAHKSTQVESPPPSLKTLSLSDSETCNTNNKIKQLPPNDYFRFPKSKASSSPVISLNSPPLPANANSSKPISHSFLAAIDNDTFKKSGFTAEHHSLSFEKPDKSSFEQNPVNFVHNQQPNFSMSSQYISTQSMLTEEMLLNGRLSRLRYMNPQNMHLLSEPNVWATNHMGTADIFLTSPSRTKNFVPNVPPQNKRRSGSSLHSIGARKTGDFESQRATQYRSRISEIKVPSDLCNGTEWDNLSQKIWARFDERRQPQDLYEEKIKLWTQLCQEVKTLFPRYSLYLVGSTLAGFALDTSDVDMCLVSRLSTNLDHRAEAVLHLDKLRAHLQEHCQSFLKNFNLIPAKVPILRFDDTRHNIEVDLNYNNCVGIRNSHLLYCYTQLDWRLQPLAVIVKLWAQHHDINNAKDLTISSYSLILMVIHYLQCGVQPAILPCLHACYPDKFNKINGIETINMNDKIEPYHSDNKQTLGELFFGFLQYYCNFNFETYAISVRTAGLLPIDECRTHKSFKNDPSEWKQLCIEEPFDRSNTARSCCDEKIFERIKKIFYESWHLLRETKELDRLFAEPLAPPAFCTFYDNYTPIMYQPHMEYILR